MTYLFAIFTVLILGTSAYAETAQDAASRSGAVVTHACMPSVQSGQNPTIVWSIENYLSTNSYVQLRVNADQRTLVQGTLLRTETGQYKIGNYSSKIRTYKATVPTPAHQGQAHLGFYTLMSGDANSPKMFALQRPGVARTLSNSAAKEQLVSLTPVATPACSTNTIGGECVAYARQQFGGDYKKMPGLCSMANDCGAAEIYGHWDLGYGRGSVPTANSLIVINRGTGIPVGHVGVVTKVECDPSGKFKLTVNESNWSLKKKISCGNTYMLDPQTMQATRNGNSKQLEVLGFIYGEN